MRLHKLMRDKCIDFIRSDKENSPIILEVNHAPHTQV